MREFIKFLGRLCREAARRIWQFLGGKIVDRDPEFGAPRNRSGGPSVWGYSNSSGYHDGLTIGDGCFSGLGFANDRGVSLGDAFHFDLGFGNISNPEKNLLG